MKNKLIMENDIKRTLQILMNDKCEAMQRNSKCKNKGYCVCDCPYFAEAQIELENLLNNK